MVTEDMNPCCLPRRTKQRAKVSPCGSQLIVLLRFSKFLQCKASCAIQACGAQLFNGGFSVTTTDSQNFRHAYAYNSTAIEHYRCIQRTAHTDTILAHDALHCKDMENCSTILIRRTKAQLPVYTLQCLTGKVDNTGQQ